MLHFFTLTIDELNTMLTQSHQCHKQPPTLLFKQQAVVYNSRGKAMAALKKETGPALILEIPSKDDLEETPPILSRKTLESCQKAYILENTSKEQMVAHLKKAGKPFDSIALATLKTIKTQKNKRKHPDHATAAATTPTLFGGAAKTNKKNNCCYCPGANILDTKAQVIVNPVNTVSVMGAGLARTIKQSMPKEYFETYVLECKNKTLQVGKPTLYTKGKRWVLNFPTKAHWKNPSQMQFVVDGLRHLADHYKEMGIESIALPKLGCGLGGLQWYDVHKQIKEHLGETDLILHIHGELPSTPHKQTRKKRHPTFSK